MHLKTLILFLLVLPSVACSQPSQQAVEMDPKDIQVGPYRHDELPPALLARIRATTDTFESIDGITYEMAVDLYRRDLDPEGNLVLWEGMANAYTSFCRSRCGTPEERMDVYRTLLLRSMFNEEDTLERSQLKVLSLDEAKAVMQRYVLAPKPVDVVRGN